MRNGIILAGELFRLENHMFNAKLQPYIFAFVMGFFMSGIMSFVISVFNVGLVDNIFSLWLQAWSFAFIVAFPTIVLISPMVKKITSTLVKN